MMTLKPKVNHALKPKPKASYQPIQGSSRGRLIALIGTPGIGKTSLAAEFPNPRFVIDPKESGIIDLQESGQVRSDIPYKNVADFTDLIKYNEDLLYNEPPPEIPYTIVYESISGFESQAIITCNDVDFEGRWTNAANQYQILNRDRIVADNYWAKYTNQLVRLREMGYNIILTGHSEVKNAKNPIGPDYMIETCKCSGAVWGLTDYIFENIFFLTFEVQVDKASEFVRGKAYDTAFRKMYCHKTPYCAAKNRCGISSPISADEGAKKTYLNWCAAANLDPKTLKYKRS
jgi:hypothetical protein